MKRNKTQKTRSEEIPSSETKPNGEFVLFIFLPQTENNHINFITILVSQA